MEYTDHDLVRGVKAGDKSALDILVRRWYPHVYRYIFKLVEREQDAYDLTQDVFIAMMQNLQNYHPWKRFDNWPFTIAHNKCMDFFRIQKRTVPAAESCPEQQVSVPPVEETVAVSFTVRNALAKLPATQREAVILHYFISSPQTKFPSGQTPHYRQSNHGCLLQRKLFSNFCGRTFNE